MVNTLKQTTAHIDIASNDGSYFGDALCSWLLYCVMVFTLADHTQSLILIDTLTHTYQQYEWSTIKQKQMFVSDPPLCVVNPFIFLMPS